MEKDLFLLVLALIVSAVFRINLLRVIAVVDIADRLLLYHDFKEIVMHCALIARRAIFMRACPCYAW